jgi:AraC-like DNA-binding protein
LRPGEAEKRFRLGRYLPFEDLGVFVEHYWVVEWDLKGHEPYVQEVLPHPCVHLTVEGDGSRVNGVMTKKFSYRLAGEGRVLGVRFKPGAFYPFWGSPISELTDASVGVGEAFGAEGEAFERAVLGAETDGEMVEVAEAFIRERLPEPDADADLAGKIVGCMVADRELTGVDEVAERFGLGKRKLQRIFHRHVGVSPKWVILRARVHDVTDRLADGGAANWAELALDLGYFDQAHFVRDFKALVGVAPATYAKRIRSNPPYTRPQRAPEDRPPARSAVSRALPFPRP